jgi:hypothetical protein
MPPTHVLGVQGSPCGGGVANVIPVANRTHSRAGWLTPHIDNYWQLKITYRNYWLVSPSILLSPEAGGSPKAPFAKMAGAARLAAAQVASAAPHESRRA